MSLPFTLHLRDLEFTARLGVYEWERAESRRFWLNARIEFEADDTVQQDQLSATLNYEEIEILLLNIAMEREWQLIEAMLNEMANRCLEQFSQIKRLALIVDKPQALSHCKSTAIELQRSRNSA